MDHGKASGTNRAGSKTQIVYSTTDGRQRFPDILQVTYGDKAVIGFDRYGRALGAVVPVEAVRMLAGHPDLVDDDIRERIRRAAMALLAELPNERAAIEDADEITTIEAISEARKERGKVKNVTAQKKASR